MPKINLTSPLIKFTVICFIILSFAAFTNKASADKDLDDKNYHIKLQIINDKQDAIGNFLVKSAKSPKERENGLMWITNLPQNYGMIFEFKDEQMVYMWMKNTKIPLDMIFIDQNNKITHITHQAKPESLEIISSQNPVMKVLEINGGLTDELGIEVGDLVKY
jgi:uncharacterized membrane protein (UPF0127 family)